MSRMKVALSSIVENDIYVYIRGRYLREKKGEKMEHLISWVENIHLTD